MMSGSFLHVNGLRLERACGYRIWEMIGNNTGQVVVTSNYTIYRAS
jgi:hypothetical protein